MIFDLEDLGGISQSRLLRYLQSIGFEWLTDEDKLAELWGTLPDSLKTKILLGEMEAALARS
jgi:hypothetical protein